LAIYKSVRKIDFDFYFFWYNTSVALGTLWKLFAPWMILVALTIAAFMLFQKPAFSPVSDYIRKTSRKPAAFLIALTLGGLVCQAATMKTIRGSAAGVLYANLLSNRQLRVDYRNLYQGHLETLQKGAP
jgi:ABC-type polysaccharide/polyol phosphate export permease